MLESESELESQFEGTRGTAPRPCLCPFYTPRGPAGVKPGKYQQNFGVESVLSREPLFQPTNPSRGGGGGGRGGGSNNPPPPPRTNLFPTSQGGGGIRGRPTMPQINFPLVNFIFPWYKIRVQGAGGGGAGEGWVLPPLLVVIWQCFLRARGRAISCGVSSTALLFLTFG